MEIIFIICMVILFSFLILSAYRIYKRNENNGELCASNAMCDSNKCVNNVCV